MEDICAHYTKAGFTWVPKSQEPLMFASSNMEAKSQLVSLNKSSNIVNYHKGRIWILMQKISAGLVLRVGFRFSLDPTLNTSPKPHLQKYCYVGIHVILEI